MMEYSVRVVYCTENDLEVFTSVYVIRYTAWLVGLLRMNHVHAATAALDVER